MKKATALIIISLLLIQSAAPVFADEQEPIGAYKLLSVGRFDMFINHVGGYSLYIEKDMTIDMSYASVCAVIENRDKRIEIYKQDVSRMGRSAYINYSNRFLSNWVDHYLEFSEEQRIGGHDVHVTSWSRKKLSRVENDRNHYICIEIPSGHYVYTIFIKANAPVYDLGGYSYLVENFRIEPVQAPGYVRASAPVNLAQRGWNDETVAFYGRYFADDAPLTWGIFEPDTALFDYNRLKWYEATLEYEFPIIVNYSEFQNTYRHPNLKQRLETAYNHGKVLELTLQTTNTVDGGNMIYKILSGEYDEFLRDYARVIADFGRPVLFRLGNEMNGDWCPYSSYHTSKDTIIFKEFYKYVYNFFENAGANKNTIWVWNPNGVSFPDFRWNYELMYYPGDRYVDVVGMTAYNTGTYYSDIGERWKEFYELYNDLYHKYDENYGQPLMITEFASASMGGNKEEWVIHMFEDIKMYDRIKVAIWWDGRDWDEYGNVARAYMMDETPGLLEIFRRYLKMDWRDGVFG